MATIRNRKKEPLTLEKMKEMFTGGVEVEECRNGIARISLQRNRDQHWWIDVNPLVGEINIVPVRLEISEKTYWEFVSARDELSNRLNRTFFNLPGVLYLR